MAIDRVELEVARQRVDLYRACAHPLVPTAIWLLAELDRLLAECERSAQPHPPYEQVSKTDILELLDRRCRVRPGGTPTYDLDLHRRSLDAIRSLREQLAERTLQHRTQLNNAVRLLRTSEVMEETIEEICRIVNRHLAAVKERSGDPTHAQLTPGTYPPNDT